MFPFDFFSTAKVIRGINQADRNYRSSHPDAPPVWADSIVGRFSKKMDTTAQRISDEVKYYADRTYVDDNGTTLSDIYPALSETQFNPTYSYSSSPKVQAKPITYSDWSDSAKYFGMDQATAYAEHMANTAHQREVADLRAAGLNPVLGIGSGASGVTGHTVASGGGSSSSAKKTDDGDFIDVIGATIGFLTAVKFGSSAGDFASQAVSGLGKLLGK